MFESAFEFLLILIFVVINGVFALSEIAIVSARRARLQQRADEGDPGAQAALELAGKPGRFLSTVQIGISLVSTVAGAFGGATLAEALARLLRNIAFLEPYADALAFALVVVLITYLSLVIGELVPKRLALNDPERAASLVARPMRALARIAGPLVRVLSASTDAVLNLLGVRPSDEPPITPEEVVIMVAEGARAGVFEAAEQDMMANVLRLDEWRVNRLMMPHPDVVWLDVNDPSEANWRKMADSSHSYFPVCQGDIDRVLGIVSVKAVWAQTLAGGPVDLRALLTQPLFVPESASALKALELFRNAGVTMALVIDEYGSVQGVVTLTDLLEAIAGDFPSGEEAEEPMIVQRKDGSWLLDGMLRIDDFQALFNIDKLPDQERYGYETLAGFIMARIGHIPAVGERFRWCGLNFEVLDMDGLRIDKVLVETQKAGEAGADSGVTEDCG